MYYARVFRRACRRHFCRAAQFVAALCVKSMDAADFDTVLKGIGIVSDVALAMDPVAIGSQFTRHGTVLMESVGGRHKTTSQNTFLLGLVFSSKSRTPGDSWHGDDHA